MILIIGGACQGKKRFAQELSGMDEQTFLSNMAEGFGDSLGGDSLCENFLVLAWKKRFLIGFHQWIRRVLAEGKDPEEFVRQVLKAEPEIVTMDEVGCGVVPIERAERDYREAAGRAGQMLAGHALQVYRVMCGIPIKIKG